MIDHRLLITQMLILCVVAALFGLLHIIAALSEFKKKRYSGSVMMLIGGVLVLLAVVVCVIGSPLDWEIAMFGSMLICLNAVLNGRRSGNLHWQHHAVRAAIALAIIVGFALL